MKIIICDDERMDAERAKIILLSCKCVQEEDITILTPQEMHLGLEVQDIKCDIAIMDIEYENRQFNGITLSKELNKKLPLCQIIYLTWVLEFAPEVYDTIHCYFVLKQNEEKMLPRAMEKAIQIYCDQEDHEIIELRNHGKMMYIRQADIIYAERQDRIVQIHTAQGTYQCYQSLTKIMKLLGRNFLRCHGGYVVNYNYIDTVMRESVILSNGTEIPIGLFALLVVGVAFVQVHYYRERQRAKAECERLEQSIGQMQKQYVDVVKQNQSYRQMNHELKKYQWLVQVMRENMGTVTHGQLLELVLQKKIQEAEHKQITCDVQGTLNGNLRMDEMSLVSLVMNLLDNAIEACVQTETRQIQVVIAEDPAAQMLELKLQNSKNSSQKLHANEAGMGYQTTKEDRGSHGYGTQIIQRIVDENGGTIRYVDAGDTMQITCRLCMEDKKLLSEG